MVCYSPLTAYKPAVLSKDKWTGEHYSKPVSFVKPGKDSRPIKVACGQCIGCRLEYARKWAVRIMHEAQTFPECYFVTLTISDEYRESKGSTSLDKKDLQKFFKRLRHAYKGEKAVRCFDTGELVNPIRYYACGEYGDQSAREHYHACIFNIEIPDLEFYKFSNGHRLYTSQRLEEIWTCPKLKIPMGQIVIGDVTFDSAAYCARYMLKKQKGKDKDIPLIREDTGEILEPEFSTMSRKPGLGKYWFREYQEDVYPSDFVITNGKKCNVPRTYDEWLKEIDENYLEEIKGKREAEADKYIDNNTPERLKVRETVAKARQKNLTRKL